MPRPAELERRLGHRFTDQRLLDQALTRGGPKEGNNERLEFLGDAVLDCVVAAELYQRFPKVREGELHKLQVSLIRESTLAKAARAVGLDGLLKVTVPTVNDPALADTLEALFGAVFLDADYDAARKSILLVLKPFFDEIDPERVKKDAKTKLQELLHARFKSNPVYALTQTRGAAHQRAFDVECRVKELSLVAAGTGTSKQRAEQEAAAAMLKLMDKA